MAVAFFVVAFVLGVYGVFYFVYRIIKWLWFKISRLNNSPEDTNEQDEISCGLTQESLPWGRSTLDAHGFSLVKASTEIPKYLKMKQKEYVDSGFHKDYQMVRINTGRGRHSPNENPVLKPAVERYLVKNNYRFNWDDAGGIVRIFLPKRHFRDTESEDTLAQRRRQNTDFEQPRRQYTYLNQLQRQYKNLEQPRSQHAESDLPRRQYTHSEQPQKLDLIDQLLRQYTHQATRRL